MKLVSWNVNGIRAILRKNFNEVFSHMDADIFCLQETKLSEGQLDNEYAGYKSYWNYAQKKGYSGTAVYTRIEPLTVTRGIGSAEHDDEGRALTLEFDKFFLVNVYVPNSQDQLARIDFRLRWEDELRRYLKELDSRKPVVLCGDLNVAHNDIDLRYPDRNRGATGFSDEERNALTSLLDSGFADTFRRLHPDEQTYSWWSYRYSARAKNIGWRIDYFLVSERLMPKVSAATIHNDIEGSDHCPVSLELNI